MCTFQDSTGTEACVDMGAQYISTTPEAYVQHQRLFTLSTWKLDYVFIITLQLQVFK